jgi:hypothetical protein
LTLAEKLFAETGKKTRLYIGDGGLATVTESGAVEDGIVEVMEFASREYPLSVIQHMTAGYWPENSSPSSKLVPPPADFKDKYAMCVFEGLTVMSSYLMGSIKGGLAERAAAGEKMGQDPAFVVSDPSQDGTGKGLRFGGNSPAHFGFAQNRIIDAILRSKALPVQMVIWTAHERLSEDKDNGGEKIIGPDAAGKALTAKIPLWFGNTIHLTTAAKRTKKKDETTGRDIDSIIMERRAYTRDHCDPDGATAVKFIANNRCPLSPDQKGKMVSLMPEYLSPPDPLRFYQIMAEARHARRAALQHSASLQ